MQQLKSRVTLSVYEEENLVEVVSQTAYYQRDTVMELPIPNCDQACFDKL